MKGIPPDNPIAYSLFTILIIPHPPWEVLLGKILHHIMMKVIRQSAILLFVLTVSFSDLAQSSLGTWNILNVKYGINEKWSANLEGQIRSLKFYDNFHYHEVKLVLNRKITSGFRVSTGFGKYDTYNEVGNFRTPMNNSEYRLWPQFVLTHKQGPINFEHRYRAELRFAKDNFRTRFRYRFGINYSFGKTEKVSDVFKISISNELFFSPFEPYFERNRFLVGFDYRLNETVTLHTGYLFQFDYKIVDEIGRDFFQVGCYLSFGK